MVKVLLDDTAKVLSGVDQRHRGLVDTPDGFIWWGRTNPPPLAPQIVRTMQVLFECPRGCAGYGAAALVAITGVAGGERETALGSAAAEGSSLQVRGRWIKMAGALPRPASCVCVLLSSLFLCTRVRVVLVVVAAAVEFAVVSLYLFPLPHAGPPMPMPPCSGSHFGFLVSHPFSQPTSFLTNLLVSPREAPCAPLSLSLLCLFNDHLCSLQMPFLSFPVLSLFVLTHPFLTYPASW